MLKILLLVLTSVKFGKVLLVVGTMLLSLIIYAKLYGLPYAAGFIALLFVHEMGHFVAAWQKGLKVSLPMFIPFVGAWIELKEQPMNAETEAYVAFAGPFVGSLGALGCYYLARRYDSDTLMAVAYSGFFLNLFNLIPISPLDGGRITAILSPRVWLLGVPILIMVFVFHPSPMLILIAIIAIPSLSKAWHYNPKLPQNAIYYGTSLEAKIMYGTFYLALAVFLAVMCQNVHQMLGH